MEHIKRITAVLLASVMAGAAMASCGESAGSAPASTTAAGEGSPEAAETTAEAETTIIPDDLPSDLNFGGREFRIGYRDDSTLKPVYAAEADGERAALRMFNEIFGGSPVSKLFMNVREKMSLCYYCSSSMDALKGVLFVHSGIENETRETAEEAILTQLDEIRAGHITDEELEAARRSLISSLRQMDDAPNPRPSWLLARRVAGRPVTVKEEAAQIAAVRREDVARLAQNVTLGAVYFLRGTLADAAAGEDGEEENA